MSNQLLIPILNTVHFVPVNPGIPSQYNTPYFEDYLFSDTLFDWQEKPPFYQPYLSNDLIKFQFEANFSGLQLDLVDCEGSVLITLAANQVRANKYQPGFFIYEATVDISALPLGLYRFLLTPGGDLSQQQKSEWINILPSGTKTILLEYRNSRYHGDVVFETGISFGLRIPGYMKFGTPSSKTQLYEDQVLNETLLSGKPFNTWKIYVGDGTGVPPWFIDKINRAFCCNTVTADGKSVAMSDGKWNEFEQELYPLLGYMMELREGINRSSRIVNSAIDPNKKVILTLPLDTRIFGDVSGNAGENTINILSAE